MSRPDYAAEIRRTLKDPRKVCQALGLMRKFEPNGSGLLVCCPIQNEKNPSFSVTPGRDGTLRFVCFSCKATGDVLTLVALVHDLDLRTNFKEVLLEAATIAGLDCVVDELNGREIYKPRPLPELPDPEPERGYPLAADVYGLWQASCPVTADDVVGGHLIGRKLDPHGIQSLDLARAIQAGASTPSWARYRGQPWSESGHRLLLPVVDAHGAVQSVRAWRVEGEAAAKRLPPSGHRATGLALANGRARRMLEAPGAPKQIIVVEGEPDFLSASLTWPTNPVIGVMSGTWSADFAARIPIGSEVIVMTHNDRAGDKYADDIIGTIKSRAVVRRTEAA